MPPKFKAVREFACPFCGLRVAVSVQPCAVLHAVPMCDRFEHLEPVDFMRACNDELERRRLN
jgi:hypothetical protein